MKETDEAVAVRGDVDDLIFPLENGWLASDR